MNQRKTLIQKLNLSNNEKVQYLKASHSKKRYFQSYIEFGVRIFSSFFLNIRTISQFTVNYIIKWYEIVLTYKVKQNRCFYSWFELRLKAAIVKYPRKYVLWKLNSQISNYLNSKQNSWKIPAKKFIFCLKLKYLK